MPQTPLKACVIGSPITHSLSPKLHGFWLRENNISGSYHAIDVPASDLKSFLSSLHRNGYQGCNITLPHKINALNFVDEICPTAQNIGAINTVIVCPDGKLFGTNTDAYGFICNLKQQHPQWHGAGKKALILGAGGASRAVISALINDGLSHIYISNRTRAHAEKLQTDFSNQTCILSTIDWLEKEDILPQIDLLVNTTSLGMVGKTKLQIDLSQLPTSATVYDIVYCPLKTDLLRQAEKKSCPIVTGLGMLLHQGRPGFKAWFGCTPEVSADLEKFMIEQTS